MTPNGHCTDEELFGLLDGACGKSVALELRAHLAVCDACAERERGLRSFEYAMRRLPMAEAPHGLAAGVLTRLGIPQPRSFFFGLVENAVLGLGMFTVLGVMVWVFIMAGVIDTREVAAEGTRLGLVAQQAGGTILRAIDAVNDTVRRYTPFLAEGRAAGITVSLILVVVALLGADRILGRRFAQRW
jgi:anti-sigma factor RsiW